MKQRIPIIDFSKCIHCEQCIGICPEQAIIKARSAVCEKCVRYCITLAVPCNPYVFVFDYNKCTACGLCLSICPTKAVSWFTPKAGTHAQKA